MLSFSQSLLLSLLGFSSVALAESEAQILEPGVSFVAPSFALPDGYNWSGAPASFKEAHSGMQTATEEGGSREDGGKKTWFFDMERKLAVKYDTAMPASKPALSLDQINTIDIDVLMNEGEAAYLGNTNCTTSNLLGMVQKEGARELQYAHLYYIVNVYTQDEKDGVLGEDGYNLFYFPLKLNNGECDVVYGPAN